MRLVGAVLLLLASAVVCMATGRWWLAARRRDAHNYNDRKIAISLVGLGVMGIVAAVQLLS